MSLSLAQARALGVLERGGVILQATEGVWGFACDARATGALERILRIKERDAAKGFIVIAGAADVFRDELAALAAPQQAFIQAAWPGSATQILRDVRGVFDRLITGGRGTIAARVPGHAQARGLAHAFGGALVSTSANVSGAQPITDYARAVVQFADRVDFVLPGRVNLAGKASRIYDVDGSVLRA